MLLGFTAFSQTNFVIKDQNGNLFPNAHAYKRNKLLATSDSLGRMKIPNVMKNDTLWFSFDFALSSIMYIAPENNPKGIQEITVFDFPDAVYPPPPAEEPVIENPAKEIEISYGCEPEAYFPGGHAKLKEYLGKHLNYPERALKDSIEGKCYVQFVVKANGQTANAKIVRSIPNCPECDAEVIRIILAMPKWIPPKIDGKPVNSYMTLPINFKLGE